MAKKKKISNNLLNLIAIILGLITISMIFLTNFVVSGSVTGALDGNYTGLQTIFGHTVKNEPILMFSFMTLLPYLLTIIAVALLIFKMVKKPKCKILDFIISGCYVVSGILFLLTTKFVVLSESYTNLINIANALKTVVTSSLGYGVIIAATSSILAGIIVLVNKFKK